jgi:transcription-repair coupling factor (superfamily II helicase)
MLEYVFSDRLAERLKSTGNTTIAGGDRDLAELYAAGVAALLEKNIIWVVGENEDFEEKEARLRLWLKFFGLKDVSICLYKRPFEDPYIHNSTDWKALDHKAKLISRLQKGQRCLILTTLSALSIKIEDPGRFDDMVFSLKTGAHLNRDDFTGAMIDRGYTVREAVEEKGDIAWRGSIVDIFPPGQANPLRFEFEGSSVVSIRTFEPETQKSIRTAAGAELPLARFFADYESVEEYLNKGQRGMKFLNDIVGEYRLVVSDMRQLKAEYHKLMDHYRKIFQIAHKKRRVGKSPEGIFTFPIDRQLLLSIDETYDRVAGETEIVRFKKGIVDLQQEDIEAVKEKLTRHRFRLRVFSPAREMEYHLKQYFGDFDFYAYPLPCSFENNFTRTLFLTRQNFRLLEKPKKQRAQRSELLVNEIQKNDYVVHQKHGIGRFVGFHRLQLKGFDHFLSPNYWKTTQGAGGNATEFLKIEYQNREYLYVPVYELGELSKYAAFEGSVPGIDRLGGRSWQLKQTKARKSMIHFARELLNLYALRKAIKGHAYTAEPELEPKLQQQFQYVETEDQKRAIRDVLRDLEAEYPMDRLVCGDVSFGKTEVAIRAAFRVVSNGKQVAFLCPTTILAFQHYNTFQTRLAPFPVRVALLSRMVPGKEREAVARELASGKIDIVIGTHALLSRNIQFKDLGLYIIDEEQRFGVFQKEKLKQKQEEVDVLSLSATPIPRTMSLSLSGLQDISLIRTPPIGRLAVKNYVGYFSRELVVSAVLNEVERDGLVYIVYNNIDRIYSFKERLQQWLPEISLGVIHARMKNEVIEKTLMDFIGQKFRVLISTTIIENGIDIPAVNTLVVIRAERYGLTQLYQLRGRIGRSNRQAYAYFLVSSPHIPDKAKARLEAVREFSDLGSGYKLAEFDLKLRGAGSLLGNKQHGHVEALGFDYYLELLNRTIKELKGETEKRQEMAFNIHFSYSVERDYIQSEVERIAFYRSVIEAEKLEGLEEIKRDLIDRYGKPPAGVEKIFSVSAIRVIARRQGFAGVDLYDDRLVIKFPDASPSIRRLSGLLNGRLSGQDTIEFTFHHLQDFVSGFTDSLAPKQKVGGPITNGAP